jgi:hypothetical protein
MEAADEEWRSREADNRWYFFVPPALVGVWVLVAIARAIAQSIVPGGLVAGAESEEAAESLRLALDVVDWLGGVGWVLLFLFYFVVLSRKRASAWWSLGAFCCGPNLVFYIVLLFLPTRRFVMRSPEELEPLEPLTFGREEPRRPLGLKDSFVCEACDSVLNLGVSECRECGARYRYEAGQPLLIE